MTKANKSTKRYNQKHRDLPKRKSLTKIINKRKEQKINNKTLKEEPQNNSLEFENLNNKTDNKNAGDDVESELESVSEDDASNDSNEKTDSEEGSSSEKGQMDLDSQSEGEELNYEEELKKVMETDKEYTKYHVERKASAEENEQIVGLFDEEVSNETIEKLSKYNNLNSVTEEDLDKLIECLEFVIESKGSKPKTEEKKKEKKLYIRSYQVAKSFIIDFISAVNNYENNEEESAEDSLDTMTKSIIEIYTYSNDRELILKALELTNPFINKYKTIKKYYKELAKSITKHLILASKTKESKTLLFDNITFLIRANDEIAETVYKMLYKKLLEYSNIKIQPKEKKITPIINGLLYFLKLSDVDAFSFIFVNIRKLAQLVSRISTANNNRFQIYNWQFMITLRLISSFICETSSGDQTQKAKNKIDMRELIYPFVELLMGVCFTVKMQCYLPFKLKIIDILNDIMASTKTFIPLIAIILEVMDSKIIRERCKKAIDGYMPQQFRSTLILSDIELSQENVLDILVDEINLAMLRFMQNICSSISFPEVTQPVIKYLKKYMETRTFYLPKLNQNLTKLIQEIEKNSEVIKMKRADITFDDSSNILNMNFDLIDPKDSNITTYYNRLKSFENHLYQGNPAPKPKKVKE